MSELIELAQIAHARSGDKGNHANVAVIAYNDAGYEYLKQELTCERVGEHFAALNPTQVERFELPGVRAINFLLYNVLGGGGSQAVFLDTQGKTLGLICLQMKIPRPENVQEMVNSTFQTGESA